MKCYYEILGLDKGASDKDIQTAYRKLAVKWHPDANPDDPNAADRFKEVAQAYEVLSDPQKRQQYDTFGHVDGGSPVSGGGFHFNINPFDMFGDLFPDAFGNTFRGRGHPYGQRKGPDILKEVNITLEEVYNGAIKEISTSTQKECVDCKGSGLKSWDKCSLCAGAGRIHNQKGSFSIVVTCSKCHGSGRQSVVSCSKCSGVGHVDDQLTVHKLDIPPGVRHGDNLILKGLGQPLQGGVNGDVVCVIRVKQHKLFKVEHKNLLCTIPITFPQSILGHKVSLPLLSGQTADVSIPAGTRSGAILKLGGFGLPPGPGDLYVRIQVDVPQNPSPDYINLVKKLSELDDKQEYDHIKEFRFVCQEVKNKGADDE